MLFQRFTTSEAAPGVFTLAEVFQDGASFEEHVESEGVCVWGGIVAPPH